MAWWDDIVEWGGNQLGDVKWGDYLPGLAKTGMELWSQIGGKDEANALAQQQAAQQQAQFDAEMAYKYAALAKSGGGGGPDPRMLAIQRQQANDAFFAKQRELNQEANKSVSESLRGIASSYARAYGR